jgi:hypothetical protein
MVGRRSTKDVATDESSEDTTTEGQRTLCGFRAVYVFERLSRDLWPIFYPPDGLANRCSERTFDSSSYIIAQSFVLAQRCFRLKLSALFVHKYAVLSTMV